MKQDHLTRASRLIKQKKYDSAIKILQAEENRYHNSFTYYHLLAIAHLYSEIYGRAFTYFDLAKKIKMRDVSVLLGIACLYLNHGDTDRAVDIYLDVQEIDEKNPIARRALKIIRQNPGPENVSAWIESGNLHKLYPPKPKVPVNKGFIALCFALTLVIAGAAFGAYKFFSTAESSHRDISKLKLERSDINAPMQEDSFRYLLKPDEVLSKYNEALRLFSQNNDDGARVLLNNLLESNSPEQIKNKARLLTTYLETPGFDNIKEKYSLTQVASDPVLYRNCTVNWRGTISNLVREPNSTTFDLLVGYYGTRSIFEGAVRVVFDFAVAINTDRDLEVLGTVIPDTSESTGIRIQGITVKQTGLTSGAQTGNQNR